MRERKCILCACVFYEGARERSKGVRSEVAAFVYVVHEGVFLYVFACLCM